ncbi:MAG: cupredoxin domain-containing protein [Candidatus Methylomirabilales bacterium]
MRRWIVGGWAVLLAALAAPALPPTPKAAAQEGRQETVVETQDFKFSTPTITVNVGATIVFKNTGKAPHTATSKDKSFDTGNINPGESKSITVRKAGNFDFECIYHIPQGMVGSVLVQGGGEQSAASPGPTGPAGSPPTSPTGANSEKKPTGREPLATQPTEKYFRPLAGVLVGALVVGVALSYMRSQRKARSR